MDSAPMTPFRAHRVLRLCLMAVLLPAAVPPPAAGATTAGPTTAAIPAEFPEGRRLGEIDGPSIHLGNPLPGSAAGTAFTPPERPWGRGHRGLDFPASPGQQVRSPVSGVVRFVGVIAGRGVLSIEPATGAAYRVTLEPVHSPLRAGQSVDLGSPVGWVGTGGHCDRRCLHLGIRGPAGYVDPWPLIVDRGPVLKPP